MLMLMLMLMIPLMLMLMLLLMAMVMVMLICSAYKGFDPRAADAARFARVSKNTTKCEGGRKERLMMWCSR